MSFPGGPGTTLARRSGQRPIWMIPTARGPAAVALEHDGLLDREDIMLEDVYFPGAAEHVERVVNFLRAQRHPALPRHVDDWIARDRTVHQYSPISGLDGPVHHLLTERGPGRPGFRYLQDHRSRGLGLPPAVALRVILGLADACRLAHADGVVHGGILLGHAVRIAANGRAVLEGWAGGRRAVGNVGCDFEGLWYGVRDLLGGEVPSPLPAGDVFALGSLLALLVTGAPAYVRGPGRYVYRPPSASGPAFAWLDELVGLACDPSQGFVMTAGALAQRIAALLEQHRPARECVLADLAAGDFRSLAAHVACEPSPDVGALADAVCDAVRRDLLGALTRERAVPVFSELLLATCPAALPMVRSYARTAANPRWGRGIAARLLALHCDPDALALALELELDGWAALGWSVRPELVAASGAPCPHPWTSLTGEPSPTEPAALQRECRQCGPVRSARVWLEARRRAEPPAQSEMPTFPTLVVITGDGTHERPLWPGGLCGLGSDAGQQLALAGLDPADHASISAVDAYRVVFTFGVFDLPFCDGSELRVSVLDTRTTGDSLVIGPLRFEASAPGQVTVRVPAGVPLAVRPR